MQIKQRFVVPHPRDAVWAFFGRMAEVTPCMPGASLAEAPDDRHAKFKLNVKLGPISAAFAGDAELERNDQTYQGVMRGTARDTRGDSRVKGMVDYALRDENDGSATAVDIAVEFALTGRLAQFSRGGIVNDLAERLTVEFARNLETALNAEAETAATCTVAQAETTTTTLERPLASTTQNSPPGAQTLRPPAELKAGKLLFSVILARLKRMVGWLFGHR